MGRSWDFVFATLAKTYSRLARRPVDSPSRATCKTPASAIEIISATDANVRGERSMEPRKIACDPRGMGLCLCKCDRNFFVLGASHRVDFSRRAAHEMSGQSLWNLSRAQMEVIATNDHLSAGKPSPGSVDGEARNAGLSASHHQNQRVNVRPSTAAKRQVAAWAGIRAEIVQFTGQQPLEYEFRAGVHLLTVCERGLRLAGETRIEGLPPSQLRNFSGKMCLVPAAHTFHGTYVPRIAPRTTYFYIDPVKLVVDHEDFRDFELTPLLFFENAALWATAAKLNALIAKPGTGTLLYAEALTSVLAIELIRLSCGAPVAPPPAHGHLAPWQRRIVCDYIEEHLGEELSLQELSDLVRLSPTHFARVFKQTLNMPPHRYQIHRRIERAKRMLADPHRSVTDIAMACGFGFPGNFSTAFRKHAGLSPTEFRSSLD